VLASAKAKAHRPKAKAKAAQSPSGSKRSSSAAAKSAATEKKTRKASEVVGVVDTIEEAFRWPAAYLRALNNHSHHGPEVLRGVTAEAKLSARFASWTVSMAYGGIDSPGTAISMLAEQLEAVTGHHKEPVILYNIEKDVPCQNLLVNAPNPCCCLFADLNEFWADHVRATLDRLHAEGAPLTLDSMLPLIHDSNSVKLRGSCLVHERLCTLKRSTVHVAGPNCQPYSPAGKGEGTEKTLRRCCPAERG
jgi:hypothetical protein